MPEPWKPGDQPGLLPVFLWAGDLAVTDGERLQLGIEQGLAMYTAEP